MGHRPVQSIPAVPFNKGIVEKLFQRSYFTSPLPPLVPQEFTGPAEAGNGGYVFRTRPQFPFLRSSECIGPDFNTGSYIEGSDPLRPVHLMAGDT